MAERIRWTGEGDVELAIPGGSLQFPRMKWQDPVKLAEEAHIDPRHLDPVLSNLGAQWEREGPVKAARTRKQNAADDKPDEGATSDDEEKQ